MSKAAEQELGLIGQHNYAILDLKEQDGREMVLVKNPWCEATLWANAELTVDTPEDESLPVPLQRLRERPLSRLPPSGNELAPGTFWMTLSDVFQNFESIYLNWNPEMFSHRQDIHFEWNLATAHRSSNSLAENPQFSLASKKDGTVWLLLCRHFRIDSKIKKLGSKGRDGMLVNLQTINEGQGESTGHISLLVFDNDGKRVYDEIGAIEQGPYVDSMQTLLRLQMPSNKPYTVAIAEQYLPAESHNFTLIAYSTVAVVLAKVEEKYENSTTLESEWNSFNSGGSTNSPSFSINPQFKLEVYEPTPVAILLECCETERNVNVKLCYGNGKRLFGVKRQDIMLDTYEYRKGSSFVHTKGELVEPGKYTIIASTFEAGQKGKFGLRVDSNTRIKLDKIPSEIHGKLSLQLPKAIFEGQASRIGIHLNPLRMSNISIIIKFASSYSPHTRESASSATNPNIMDAVSIDSLQVRSPLRVTLQLGHGPNAEELAVSNDGDFSDATDIGLRIFDVHIYRELSRKGDLFLFMERMGKGVPGSQERYNVEILMADVDSRALEAGRWETWEE
jgi:calpain-7